MSSFAALRTILPGLAAAIGVTLLAFAVERLEAVLFGYPWVDALVLAILIGVAGNSLFGMPKAAVAGVKFASKTLLEWAIVLLGASISFATIAHSGLFMVASVVAIVVLSLLFSYGIARLLGLPSQLAVLVACGNSICGNSAIVATAPAIGARADDVAAAISFTAALGIMVVLLLPSLVPLLGLSDWQYGVLAGMTVYAVPQVLAATVPVSAASTQIGTIVKLLRVLMLGPVVLALGLIHGRQGGAKPKLSSLVPWFILGFLGMMVLRSLGLIPAEALKPIATATSLLTIVSMAALGLSVNLRTVLAAGGRVLAAGALSIAVLGALAAIVLVLSPAMP